MAAVDDVDVKGTSALHAACAANSLAFVELLLLCGAAPLLPAFDSSTPLHSLATVGPSASPDIARALLRYVGPKKPATLATDTKSTPMHVAAYCGAADLIEVYKTVCGLNDQNASGYTPIVLAIQMNHLECVKRLIAEGAEVNVVPVEKCAPPILFAAQKNNNAVVKVLLDAGADPNATTDSQQAALYRAASLNKRCHGAPAAREGRARQLRGR